MSKNSCESHKALRERGMGLIESLQFDEIEVFSKEIQAYKNAVFAFNTASENPSNIADLIAIVRVIDIAVDPTE